MTIHEFGTENKDTVILLHPSAVMWDYFEYVIPLLENKYHLIVPALPGYDEESLRDRLNAMYEEADVSRVEGMGCFRCRK